MTKLMCCSDSNSLSEAWSIIVLHEEIKLHILKPGIMSAPKLLDNRKALHPAGDNIDQLISRILFMRDDFEAKVVPIRKDADRKKWLMPEEPQGYIKCKKYDPLWKGGFTKISIDIHLFWPRAFSKNPMPGRVSGTLITNAFPLLE